jgi:peptide deformylase
VAIRPIARLGEPVLRRVAEPLGPEHLRTSWFETLVSDLIDTMRASSGAGLAAPQVFESVRVVVIEVQRNDRYPTFPTIPLTVLVNPRVQPLPGTGCVAIYEGCLSVPGLRGRAVRPRQVSLSHLSPGGEAIERTVEGVEAAVLQHELDHLDGQLFVDLADPRTLTYLDEFERAVPLEQRVVDPVIG